MPPLNLDILGSNAYRTLGLPASESQADVDRAARKMRIWTDSNRIPPTPWDFPGFGAIARTKNDVEQAVIRLQEPHQRMQERLFWLHTETAAKAGPSIEALDHAASDWVNSPDPAARHDAALAALQAAMLTDLDVHNESLWARAMDHFEKLASSEDYRRWLHRIEEDGDYEKSAHPREIDRALETIPASIAETLLERAGSMIGELETARCGRILRLLGRVGHLEAQHRLLDRIEDTLERNCRHVSDDIDRRVNFDSKQFEQAKLMNELVAHESAAFYKKQIAPLRVLVETGGMSDPARTARLRALSARALWRVAIAWEWSGDYPTADDTYHIALALAPGSAVEKTIRADLDNNSRRAERQRDKLYDEKERQSTPTQWVLVLLGMVVAGLISLVTSGPSTPTPPPAPPVVPHVYDPQVIQQFLERSRKRPGATPDDSSRFNPLLNPALEPKSTTRPTDIEGR